MVYYLHHILTSAYISQQMKQNSDVDMKFSMFENVEKSLAELAFSVKVQISTMQYMPHAIHMFLTLIKAGLFFATSLTHDGNG
jgi:REP element-mobilizing transposase RayT